VGLLSWEYGRRERWQLRPFSARIAGRWYEPFVPSVSRPRVAPLTEGEAVERVDAESEEEAEARRRDDAREAIRPSVSLR
jgi:hypothetical protein